MKYLALATMFVAGAFTLLANAEEGEKVDQPIELGNVKWLRSLDTAVANSKKEDKPIAILFQEVPG